MLRPHPRTTLFPYTTLFRSAGTERVDRQRNVQVRVNNKNYVVRSRRTFVEKSVETEMNDRSVANLFYPQSTNDLGIVRSEEHTSELQSRLHLVCRLLLEKKK